MKAYIYIFAVITLLFGLSSCYERIEACLDPYAKNYDLTSDDGCKACCLYPAFNIGITHNINGKTYSLNTKYVTSFGDTFTVLDQAFYISKISLSTPQNEPLVNLSQKEFTLNGEKAVVDEDYCLMRSTSITCVVGSAKFAGEVKTLSFFIGLDDSLSKLDSASVASDRNLSHKEILYVGGKYKSAFFKVRSQSGVEKLIYLDKVIPIKLSSENSFTNKLGQVIVFPIKINYDELFANINFDLMNEASIAETINENFSKAITNK